jgi:hypothetical protein
LNGVSQLLPVASRLLPFRSTDPKNIESEEGRGLSLSDVTGYERDSDARGGLKNYQ